jgi:AcrR family transcriptional regulator
MARPKNEKNREAIAAEAWRLFFELGYEETTYQAVADRCGVTRALVQHYFPAKIDFAVGLFRDILNKLALALDGFPYEHRFQNLLLIGESFFGYLLKNTNSRRLTVDILSSRTLTAKVLAFNIEWAEGFIKIAPSPQYVETFSDNVTSAMGGFYELLFQKLSQGRPIDLHDQLVRVVSVFWSGYGIAQDQAHQVLATTVLMERRLIEKSYRTLDSQLGLASFQE